MSKRSSENEEPAGETACLWCEKPFESPDIGATPVCPHCYKLLSRAGVPEYEIFDLAGPEGNKSSWGGSGAKTETFSEEP